MLLGRCRRGHRPRCDAARIAPVSVRPAPAVPRAVAGAIDPVPHRPRQQTVTRKPDAVSHAQAHSFGQKRERPKKIRAGWLEEPPAVGTCQIERSGGRPARGRSRTVGGLFFWMRSRHPWTGLSYAADRWVRTKRFKAPRVPTARTLCPADTPDHADSLRISGVVPRVSSHGGSAAQPVAVGKEPPSTRFG